MCPYHSHRISPFPLGAFSEIDFEDKRSKVCGFTIDSNVNHKNDMWGTVKIKEKLKQYGVLPELLGRITYTVRLNQLGDNDYKEILLRKVVSATSEFYEFYDDIALDVEDAAIEEVVSQTIKCHLGERELQNIMHCIVEKNNDVRWW